MQTLDEINNDTLLMLAGREYDACLSVYLPVVKSGRETRQNEIRLKGLIDTAEGKFHAYGVDEKLAQQLIKPLRERVDTVSFWETRPEGLSFFVAPDEGYVFRSPVSFHAEAIVDRRFYIRPLLPLVDRTLTLDIVFLGREGARLVRCGLGRYEEIVPPENLRSLQAYLKNYEFEESLQFSSNAGAPVSGKEATPGYHGQGVAGDDATDNAYLKDYYRHFKNWLADFATSTLYLAGTDRDIGTFAKIASDLPGEQKTLIHKDIKDLAEQDLKQYAGEELNRLIKERMDDIFGRFLHEESAAPQKTLHEPGPIVTAAHDKRIETLFIPPEDRQHWGHFDVQNHRTIIERSPLPVVGEELFNLAAIRTLQNGGQVLVQDSVDEGAALCRW